MGNDLGYYVDKKLKSAKKKSVAVKDDSLLKIAHCFDLFESGECKICHSSSNHW